MRSNIYIIVLLGLLLIGSVDARGCANEGWKGYGKLYTNKTVTITCPTCTFINISGTNPLQEQFLDNVAMTNSGSIFTFTFSETDNNNTGTYLIDGYSNLDDPLAFCYDVTLTGKSISISVYFILLLVLGLAFVLLIWLSRTFDKTRRDQIYKKIVTNYFNSSNGSKKGDLGTVIIYTFIHSLLQSLFVFYYLVGVLFMLILAEMVDAMAVTSLITLFTTLFNLTLWLFIPIFIIFIFRIFELIKSLMNDIKDLMLGIGK